MIDMEYFDLSEICDVKTGKLDANASVEGGKYPFFTCSRSISWIDTYAYDCACVLLAGNGEFNVHIYDGKFNAYQRTYIITIKPHKIYNLKLIYYIVMRSVERFKRISVGGVIKFIKIGDVYSIKLPNISFNDQKSIVDLLEHTETLIDKSKKQLLLLDELVKSRFNDMFAESLINKTRTCKFSDICESLIGLTYKPENVSDAGTIVLRSGNIQDGELYLKDDVVRVNNIAIKGEKMVRPLDILMCSRNGSSRLVGKTCIIKNTNEPMTFGAFMAIIRTPFPYIVNAFMNTNYFRYQLTGTQTASVNQITIKMLYDYDIFLPTLEEEKEFRRFVELIDKSKFNLQRRIETLTELFNKKMDEFFGGND